ncbi:MAG: sugar transferase, partial [Bacteroidota bacterium]
MYALVKRFFDFLFSLLAIIILAPLLIPIMIGLLLTGEGYIWYFQKRVGYKNQLFDIWKFATMLKNSPNMKGGAITMKNDPRIT